MPFIVILFEMEPSRKIQSCMRVCLLLLFVATSATAQFRYRTYYGWITDLASQGRPDDAWPSTRIDDGLLRDYDENLAFMHEIGLNHLGVWGLFISREWPLEIDQATDDTRRRQVMTILDKAHRYNIKVLAGMGVYSWGFDAIIRAHPELACPQNPSAMCLHNPESWEWQKKVIDYNFSFPIDGVNLQSADLGRCTCGDSKDISDIEYHAMLNQKVVQYIREHYPGKIIGISSWGMDISKTDDLPFLRLMTTDVDYFTDVRGWRARNRTPGFREQMVKVIAPCAFGTIGTPNIEPPQHWQRDRWFLPTAKRATADLQVLYREGGRSVENFMHIKANPGDEATMRLQAAIELDPSADWKQAYTSILADMFTVSTPAVATRLTDFFLAAEDAYFENLKSYDPYSADISLEPLVSDKSGDPVYILNQMTKDGMRAYLAAIEKLIADSERLREKVSNKQRMETITACLRNTKSDILWSLSQ